jgi:hypothetical protein
VNQRRQTFCHYLGYALCNGSVLIQQGIETVLLKYHAGGLLDGPHRGGMSFVGYKGHFTDHVAKAQLVNFALPSGFKGPDQTIQGMAAGLV